MQKKPLQQRPAYLIESVDNALRLLQLLRDEGRLRLTDAAEHLGVAQSTAHRLLSMLVYRGFAVQDDSRAYQPGPGMGNGPTGLGQVRELRDLALPHLELLSAQLDETVNLMIRVGTRVRFLASIEADNARRVGDRRGTVLPARLASGGRALLAHLDEAGLRRLYRGTDTGPSAELLSEDGFAALCAELELVRRNGYALNIEQTETGVAAVGTALVGAGGEAVAAISISTTRDRFRRLFDDRLLPLLFRAREDLERDLRAARIEATAPPTPPDTPPGRAGPGQQGGLTGVERQ